MEDFNGEKFDTLGNWRVIEDGSETFVGHLIFDPEEGITLSAVATIRDMPALFGGTSITKKITVVGEGTDGDQYTLYDGFVTSHGLSLGGPAKIKYLFNRGFKGVAAEKPDQLLFCSVHGHSSLLRPWYAQSFVNSHHDYERRTVTVIHTLPAPIEYEVPRERQCVRIAFDRKGPSRGIADTSVAINSRIFLGVRFDLPVTIDMVLKRYSILEHLLSLLTGKIFHSTNFQLHSDEVKINGEYYKDIYYLGIRRTAKKAKDQVYPMDILFTHPKLGNRLFGIVMNWYVIHDALTNALHARFCYEHSVYSNERLFALTSALEAIHRSLLGKKDASLAQRILEVALRFGITAEVIGDLNDVREFARRIVRLRNAEAHRSTNNFAGSGAEFVHLASKIRVLIDLMLYEAIGIPKEEIFAAMRDCSEYWFYAAADTWPWR